MQKKSRKLKHLSNSLWSCGQTLQNASANYKELESRFSEFQREAESREANLRDLIESKQNELHEIQRIVAEKNQEIEFQQSEQDRIHLHITELQSEAKSQEASLRDLVQSKQNELDEMRSKHEALVRKLEQEAKVAHQESALHRNNLDEMRKKYAELSTNFDTQSKNLAEIEVHLTAVCDEMGLLENVEQN